MRLVYFVIIFIALLAVIVSLKGCTNIKNSGHFLKTNTAISEAKLKISSESGLKNILLKDPELLDSLNKALINMKRIKVSKGGGFEIWADVTVTKNNIQSTFRTLFSKYHGWYIDLDDGTYSCAYLFELINRYAK